MENNQEKTTIREIAQRAGVSISTVSRTINKSGYVKKLTRQKVENAIATLNYQPDTHARSLKGISTHTVALIIPDILNVYYTNLAKVIEEELRIRGFTLLLGITNDQTEFFLDYLNKFVALDGDGIIYTPPPDTSTSSFVRALAQKQLPIVEVNRRREIDLFDGVEADNFGAVCMAINYLFQLNHKRIAFIVGSSTTTTGLRRLEGYRYCMNKAGIEMDSQLIKVGEFTRAYGEKATTELLRIDGKNRPTAIFPTSNRLLMGTMKILNENNLKVPEDISVIAMDDTEWLEFFTPSITTVDIAIDEMAKLAVELLADRMERKNILENPRTYSLSTTLKIRNSCRQL